MKSSSIVAGMRVRITKVKNPQWSHLVGREATVTRKHPQMARWVLNIDGLGETYNPSRRLFAAPSDCLEKIEAKP